MGKFEAEEAALIDSYGTVCGEAAAWTDERGNNSRANLPKACAPALR